MLSYVNCQERGLASCWHCLGTCMHNEGVRSCSGTAPEDASPLFELWRCSTTCGAHQVTWHQRGACQGMQLWALQSTTQAQAQQTEGLSTCHHQTLTHNIHLHQSTSKSEMQKGYS